MIKVINEIIKKNYIDIEIEENTQLKSKFFRAIDENKVICNEIDEIFSDSDEYFIFYESKDLNNERVNCECIINNILEHIQQSNINEDSKFSYMNLYIVFNKMKDKLLFDKYKNENNFKKQISSKIKEKKYNLKTKYIELNTIFIGRHNDELFSIKIYDRIRSLENSRKKYINNKQAGLEIKGLVFNAELKDIVDIYDKIGNELFDKNLRYSLKDELDVDFHIKKTLEKYPDEFWFLNNGITMIVEDDDFKLKKSNSIDINYNENTTVSIINGAQTISAAASYIYQKDNYTDIDAKVIFRVIHISKFDEEGNNDSQLKELCRQEINKISISLNRQKPIKQEDIAYTTSFVETINQLSEIDDNEYNFKIGKRSKEINEEYDLLDFAQIVKSYLGQKPGKALTKGARSLLKVNDGELLDVEIFKEDFEDAEDIDEKFREYYRPVNFASALLDKYLKFAKEIIESSNDKTENKINIASYGKLYFIAYIIYILNHKNNTDFKEFKFNIRSVSDEDIKKIIKKYIEVFNNFMIKKHNIKDGISINYFKKDELYIEFRDYECDDEISEQIEVFNKFVSEKIK